MTKLTASIDQSTQYAPVYAGDRPVATIQRRRVYEMGATWRLYRTDGSLMIASNVMERIAKALAREYSCDVEISYTYAINNQTVWITARK